VTAPASSHPRWRRPTSRSEAARAAGAGATIVGGGAALTSLAFAPRIDGDAVDLESLDLDRLDPPSLGAMVTIGRLVSDESLRRRWPAVWQAAATTATPEVRRVATVGGTVAARLPTSDLLGPLCAYDSTVVVLSSSGHPVRLPLAAYLERPPPGIVTDIVLGPAAPGCYRRFANRAGFAPALASVAGVRRPSGVMLWAGAVSGHPLPLDEEALPRLDVLRDDLHASAGYRRHLIKVLRAEVLTELVRCETDEEP
jgi:CO/xanthine dehydrogenase FAD-binding subunit